MKKLKQAEETRRERQWDARARWKALQETMTWAEAQSTARRNTAASQLRRQAQKLSR